MINLFFYQHENIYILTINVELWDLNPLVRKFPVRTARSLAAYHSSSAPYLVATAPLLESSPILTNQRENTLKQTT